MEWMASSSNKSCHPCSTLSLSIDSILSEWMVADLWLYKLLVVILNF
jgi:hypothetical protein